MAAAKEAFPKWANLPMKERARLMRRLGDLIDQNVPEIAAMETADTGLPIHQTKNVLIPRASHNFEFFAEVCQQMNGKTYPVDDKMLNYTLVQPDWRLRAGVAVERAVYDRHLEGGAVPGAGEYRGAENVRTVAADRRSSGRAGAGSRDPGWRTQCGAGLRRHRRTTRWCAIMMCAPSPSPAGTAIYRNIMKNAGLKKYSMELGGKSLGADF